jgi:hypothetical protein
MSLKASVALHGAASLERTMVNIDLDRRVRAENGELTALLVGEQLVRRPLRRQLAARTEHPLEAGCFQDSRQQGGVAAVVVSRDDV